MFWQYLHYFVINHVESALNKLFSFPFIFSVCVGVNIDMSLLELNGVNVNCLPFKQNRDSIRGGYCPWPVTGWYVTCEIIRWQHLFHNFTSTFISFLSITSFGFNTLFTWIHRPQGEHWIGKYYFFKATYM